MESRCWQKPLRNLSGKLSSLKNSSDSPDSIGTTKKAGGKPLRSLPWFQITRFDFERTRQDPEGYALPDLERGRNHYAKPAYDPYSMSVEADVGAKDFRHSDIIEEDARPSTPVMQITRRQSVDQTSTRADGSPVKPAEWFPGRDSVRWAGRY